MNMLKNVYLTNKNKNIWAQINLLIKNKNNRITKKKRMKYTMTISTKILIQIMHQLATLSGFIMFVQFGFLNVILKKKMVLLTSKEFKI